MSGPQVDCAHPLAAALAELSRVSQFERMHLGELSVDEVQRLLASASQQAVPRQLAEVVQRRSGGNALFTHELLRFLLNERLVEEREAVLRRVGEASLAGQMPEGLRDVVGRRLSGLSPEANQVLSVASVIGRDFELDVIRLVCPIVESDQHFFRGLPGPLRGPGRCARTERRCVIRGGWSMSSRTRFGLLQAAGQFRDSL